MHDAAVFIGLDLAWSDRNPTGAVLLLRSDEGYVTAEHTRLGPDDEILEWIEERSHNHYTIAAIDAPIIAPNEEGTKRWVDREVSRRFGRYEAGAYPGNRVKCARPVRLARELVKAGWSLDPERAAQGGGRHAIEVYPHVAIVGLYGLLRTIKYKKGSVADKKAELSRFQDLTHFQLPRLVPPIQPFPWEPVHPKRGRGLKDLEDRLDALICAAMALRLGNNPDDCEVIGDTDGGYIVVPRLDWPEPSRVRARGTRTPPRTRPAPTALATPKSSACACCQADVPVTGPRQCPACHHVFQGIGWGGIDAHWRARHEDIMPYEAFLSGLCPPHR